MNQKEKVAVDPVELVESGHTKRIRRRNTPQEKRRMRVARKRCQHQRQYHNLQQITHTMVSTESTVMSESARSADPGGSTSTDSPVQPNIEHIEFNAPEYEDLIGEVACTKNQLNETQKKAIQYRCMAKTYWERWRFELDERKKLVQQQRELRFQTRYSHFSPKISLSTLGSTTSVPSIDRSMLKNPTGYESSYGDESLFFARGSFGVIKLQQYRGMNVAVKEYLPRTCSASVENEANVLLRLNHPYVPLLFGMCVSQEPFIIVMQYHGVNGRSVTLHKELFEKKILSPGSYRAWLILCSELAESIRYLHEDVQIIHNDLKADNIVLTNSFTHRPSPVDMDVQIVVVDFGKATGKNSGQMYNLSYVERELYKVRFRHIAPEVIDGSMKQSVKSDMFALGKLLQIILNDSERLEGLVIIKDQLEQVCEISKKCTSTRPSDRPSAQVLFNTFELAIKRIL